MKGGESRTERLTETVGRRTFLRVIGGAAPAVAAAACSPVAPELIIPYVIPAEDVVPGVATWYASVCGECPAGCGTVVRTREGRAVKVEGNPEHPINQGALCVRGQSALQGLYNPDRLRGPQQRRVTNEASGQSVLESTDWEQAQQQLVERIQAVIASGGPGRVAVVTPLLTGTLDALVETWAAAIGARRVRYEPLAYEAIRAANRTTFGRDAFPHYEFSRPDLLISFGADFQETWLSTVGHSRDHAEARRLRGNQEARFVQVESRLSLTGANADRWLAVEPGTEGLVAAAMVHAIVAEDRVLVAAPPDGMQTQIAALVDSYSPEQVAEQAGIPAEEIRALARDFSDPATGPGRTLAIGGGVASSGPDATNAQIAINLLNYVAGNIGSTVVFGPDTSWSHASSYRDMVELTESMRSGDIDVVLLHDVNPVHTMPASVDFAGALAQVPFVASTSSFPDETTMRASVVLPAHTPLESWGDSVPRAGIRGLFQPTMKPLFDTKHFGDVLLETGRSLGDNVAAAFPRRGDFFDYLQDTWETLQPAENTGDGGSEEAADFEDFWAECQRRGGFFRTVDPVTVEIQPQLFETDLAIGATGGDRALALLVYPSLHFYDGRGANRPWLQEIPDPLMKTTWSSWVEMSSETAGALGAEEGQLIRLESDHGSVDVSLLLNDHVANGVAAMPLGQGHTEYGRYAAGRGVNPITLLDGEPEPNSGGRRWFGARVDATPLDVIRRIPRLQTEFDQQDRELARAVSLSDLAAGAVEPEPHHPSLHADHEHPIHKWGMAIDLDACNGCNACVAACYAENNIPVMGEDAMRRGRTMSWMRIERFIEPDASPVDNRFLPMLCQHCDHAPCETVCPVFATYHTDEGLNAQVYNRCVGTRYCANNCPYKVRRFNWSDQQFPEPLHLQLNPDVTARMAGVMEKCTFCVQRIQDGKGTAKDENRPVRDGDVTPACAQTCPAQAIVFGDMNDPESRVSQLSEDARAYHVLGVLNTRPAVTYLRKVSRT